MTTPAAHTSDLVQQARASLRHRVYRFHKRTFIDYLPINAKVLDIGCGNNSPAAFKALRPDLIYTGIDVADYNQQIDPGKHAHRYILVSPEQFAAKIAEFSKEFDGIVSSHNIEHCNEPDKVLVAMANALKVGGRLYLSFPSEQSARLPSRTGTLNFLDDPTHKALPVYEEVVSALKNESIRLDVALRRHRPLYGILHGLIREPVSKLQKKVMKGTWELYGFETIIWGTRTK